MKQIYDGKTKTLYDLGDEQVLIVFKDDVTGTEAGIDPGGNSVVGKIEGKGMAALRQSAYFFNLLAANGIPTHFLSLDLEKHAMIARKAQWYGLEFVVRFKAYGSFVRRYGKYIKEGAPVGCLVEITLKDDERGDPLVVDETLEVLGIMSLEQVKEAKELVKKAATVIRQDLQAKGLELLDMKFECGTVDGRLVIIDDVSTDNMRIIKNGEKVGPAELLQYTVGS
ncbi:MAG TPA: phosphoribosylaminoimidazolesuccinocarboxamide synthase [Firmicutes bacterium]|nr:phosphoribosylaminoimidazolesuccinocarboxamide synthase [Bacillota bacterium]